MPSLLKGDRQEGSNCNDRATSFRTPRFNVTERVDRQTLSLCCRSSRRYPGRAARLPEMASNGLVEAFTRLSTSDSRLNALEALIKELTPYEWRFVQSLTSTRTFRFDIIGQLPVELVSHIFSYLDTSTPWRLQLVGQTCTVVLASILADVYLAPEHCS